MKKTLLLTTGGTIAAQLGGVNVPHEVLPEQLPAEWFP